MLTDPLLFAASSGDANMGSFYSTDFAPGSSTRVYSGSIGPFEGTSKAILRVNHSKTRENAPYDTERTLIRLDIPYIGDTSTGVLTRINTASIYLVAVRPIDGVTNSAKMGQMVKGFAASLFASGTEATFDTIKAALVSTYFERLVAGEG